MKNNLPIPTPILSYKEIFGTDEPNNPIELVKHISKIELISNFASSNNRLKPPESVFYDHSVERQWGELRLFCGTSPALVEKYSQKIAAFTRIDKRWTMFNRVTNLYALELIIQSDLIKNIPDYKMTYDDWDALMKFYLCVNSLVGKNTEAKTDVNRLDFLDKFAPLFLTLNQYFTETISVFSIYRAWRLYNFIDQSELFKYTVTDYFKTILDSTYESFLLRIFIIITTKQTQNPLLRFVFSPGDTETKKIFNFFSIPRERFDSNKLEFLSIKKKPFYRASEDLYLLLDNQFLLEKTFDLFLNDFWFDCLSHRYNNDKERNKGLQEYRKMIGQFYEMYLKEILSDALSGYKYPAPKFFDDLKIKGDIELADGYIRQNKKVILSEVKSGAINARQLYAEELMTFYRNDMDKFYENFGLNQIASSLKKLRDQPLDFDKDFPVGKRIEVFPLLIYSDKALRSALFTENFSDRFKKMIDPNDFPKFQIHPLCMIHIEELEYIGGYLKNRKGSSPSIFDLLRANNKGLLYPESFDKTLTKKEIPFIPPDYVHDFFKRLANNLNADPVTQL